MSSPSADGYREVLCEIGRRVYEKGWISGHDGNFSVRLEPNLFLVTPTGRNKGFLKPEEMVLVDRDGNTIEGTGRVSSEWKMHRKCYELREDIRGIVHTHAPHSTAFAVAGLALDRCVLPEIIYTLGAVPLAPYGQPGTEAIYEGMIPLIPKANGFLLKNHGLVTLGADIWEAYHRHENIEHAARIEILARQLGRVETLTPDQVEDLKKARQEAGLPGPWPDCRCD